MCRPRTGFAGWMPPAGKEFFSYVMSRSLEDARDEIRETDRMMAELFQKRMKAVRDIAAYKKEHGLPVFDEQQEKRVLEHNISFISDDTLRQYYLSFMKAAMAVSRQYQEHLIKGDDSGKPEAGQLPQT